MSPEINFTVTLIDAGGVERSWLAPAEDPEGALGVARALAGHLPGIYSVWEPEDLLGMPVLERTIG